jgi:hypothetical protein
MIRMMRRSFAILRASTLTNARVGERKAERSAALDASLNYGAAQWMIAPRSSSS